jgi:hypothetical protein
MQYPLNRDGALEHPAFLLPARLLVQCPKHEN